MNRKVRLLAFVGCTFASTLALRGASITLTPANPALLVGQTVQLTANGAVAPIAITSGAGHNCVFYSDRSIRCTGQNSQGQVGNGGWTPVFEPIVVNGLTTPATVTAGLEHTCTLVTDGRMQCWGANYTGQLGNGTIGGFATAPGFVQNVTSAIKGISGGFFTCAMMPDRTMQCWGRNQDGQLGNGDATTDTAVPGPVLGLGPVADFAAGGYHACALMNDRTVRCWGRNARGQVGDGTDTTPVTQPHQAIGLNTAVALSLGTYHSCALLQDATVQCWGQNDFGQVGANSPGLSKVPISVSGITNAVAIGTGFMHSCAVLADGTVRCWGHNDFGQLGNGTTSDSVNPVQVQGITTARAVSLGIGHSCALLADTSVMCWGENDLGEFGVGNATNSLVPVKMHGTGVTWTSSNTSVATVSGSGLVTAVARGTATITITDSFGNTGSTPIAVKEMLTLSVIKQGDGIGTVTSAPAGINCAPTCSAQFVSDSPVTLTAAPGVDSNFTGWTGCQSVSGATCTVSMANSQAVTAIFMLKRFTLTVTKSGIGNGTVTSNPPGINCSGTGGGCASDFVIRTAVTLTATASLGSVHTGWTGCDTANGTSCTVAMNTARTVNADFLGVPLP